MRLFAPLVRILALALPCLVLPILGAVPAAATVVDQGHFDGTDTFSYSDCGYPVEVQSEFSGEYRIRAGKHKNETAFFLWENLSYREVHTRTDTGDWFVVWGNRVFNDVKATKTTDNIFEFVSVEAGQSFVVEDSLGNVVLRDRGSIRFRTVFDTGGDTEPGGTFVEFLGAEVHGPHPGFFTDFCQIADDLVGT